MSNPKIFYNNVLDGSGLAASTTATGYNVDNLRDWYPFTWWKPTALPATITRDYGGAVSCDYGLVYGEAATYEIRGSTDNFSASDVLCGTITLTATGLGFVSFNSASYRYWRVKQTGSGTPAVAIAAIGAALDMPVPLDVGFDPVGREVNASLNRSIDGHALGRVVESEIWKGKLKFNFVTWSWVRATWLAAWAAHLRDKPFGFAWDPANYPLEVRLLAVDGGFETPHQPGSWSDLQFDVAGVA